jgi:DNA polymerase-3 subunit epsilon/CBS domain-containing protein
LATAGVYAALVPRLKERGIRTIAEAMSACAELEPDTLSRKSFGAPGGPAADVVHRTVSEIDSYPYRHRVEELMSAPPLVVDGTESISAALQIMLTAGTSSTFVSSPTLGMGIVTERDILRAVAERAGAALDMPVDQIASRPLKIIDRNEFLYRALARITRLGIRHLAVVDDTGKVIGALTPRSLLRQRASAALVLGEDIDSANDGATLGAAFGRLSTVAGALVREDVEPRRIAAVISAEIAAATRRATELAEQSMAADGWGPPPVPYAVFVMGSVGRGESLLAADQDNAIVYQSGTEDGPEDRWFAELGARFAKTLDDAGIPFCKGGVMAQNKQWRHSLAGWKAVIDGWVRKQTPQDLLNVDIFFDGIPVHGDHRLADEIRTYALESGRSSRDFQALLTELARQWSPPLTLLGGIRTDDGGRVDLKKGGIMPIFTAARIVAIRNAAQERSTPDRLQILARKGGAAETDIRNVVNAHQVLLGAILCQQLTDLTQGVALSTRVAVERLSGGERTALKKAIGEVKTAVELISEGRF